jgi:hypothetical protein
MSRHEMRDSPAAAPHRVNSVSEIVTRPIIRSALIRMVLAHAQGTSGASIRRLSSRGLCTSARVYTPISFFNIETGHHRPVPRRRCISGLPPIGACRTPCRLFGLKDARRTAWRRQISNHARRSGESRIIGPSVPCAAPKTNPPSRLSIVFICPAGAEA